MPKPCDGLHNTVAVSQETYADPVGTPYDEQVVADGGNDLCQRASTAYVGAATAQFTFVAIYPAERVGSRATARWRVWSGARARTSSGR